MGRSHLAKRARQRQVKEQPAEARNSEEAEQTIAKKRRQPHGKKAAQGRTEKKRHAVDDVEVGDAANALLWRDSVVDKIGRAERDPTPGKASPDLNQHKVGGVSRPKPKSRDQSGEERA